MASLVTSSRVSDPRNAIGSTPRALAVEAAPRPNARNVAPANPVLVLMGNPPSELICAFARSKAAAALAWSRESREQGPGHRCAASRALSPVRIFRCRFQTIAVRHADVAARARRSQRRERIRFPEGAFDYRR